MEKPKVFDASALIVYFEGDSGSDKVKDIFKRAEKDRTSIFLSAVNWGEVLYATERKYGPQKKDQIEEMMNQAGIEIIDADKKITRQAAHLKNQFRLGYADAFVIALAIDKKADLITADKDFQAVENKINIVWIKE